MGRRRIPHYSAISLTCACAVQVGCNGAADKTPHTERPLKLGTVDRLAITPIINFSGQPAFDPVRAADLLASEIVARRGFTVIPVNRVLAALDRLGTPHIRTPREAIALCNLVGADAIIVAAITEFDPYAPMVVNVTMEVYSAAPGSAAGPRLIMQERFAAADEHVVARVKQFAATRTEDVGPFAWRRYLMSQESFLRFCFSEGLQTLFSAQSHQMALGKTSDE